MKVPDSTATPLDFITEQRYVLQLSRLQHSQGYWNERSVPCAKGPASVVVCMPFQVCTAQVRRDATGSRIRCRFNSFKCLIKLCFDQNVE